MTDRGPTRPAVHLVAALVGLALVALLAGCSGGGDEVNPKAAMRAAAKAFDRTSGVRIDLSTGSLPSSVNGVLSAKGVATSAPAFQGEIRVSASGIAASVPVVAVDGTTYAVLPFQKDYAAIDPGEYGAPDPAGFMALDSGIPSLLTRTRGLEAGDPVRDGSTVLTTYTGTLPGSALASVIPSAPASATFAASYELDGDRHLRSATLAGPFYGDQAGRVSYRLEVLAYGVKRQITAP